MANAWSLLSLVVLLVSNCATSTALVSGETRIDLKSTPSLLIKVVSQYDNHVKEYIDNRATILELRDIRSSSIGAPLFLGRLISRGNLKQACEFINEHNLMIARACKKINALTDYDEEQCDDAALSEEVSDCSGFTNMESTIRRETETELRQ